MKNDVIRLAKSVKLIRVGKSEGGELKDPTKRAAFASLFTPREANLPATVVSPAPAPATPEDNTALANRSLSSGPVSAENPDLISKATQTLMEAPVTRRKFLETTRNAVAAANQAGNINKLLTPIEPPHQIPEHIPETPKFDKIGFVENTLKEIFDHFEESAYDFSIPYDHLKGALEGYMKRHPKMASMKNVKNAIDELHDPEEFIKNYFDHLHFTKEELDHLGENDHLNQLLSFHDENILPNYGKYEWNDMKEAAKDAKEKRKELLAETWPKGEPEQRESGGRIEKNDGGELDNDHPDQFRELNKLGLYSKAAEVAQGATGQNATKTPEEWHKYLLNRNVKPDELKWSHFDNAFQPDEKVHKDDVAAHFNYNNQEPYTEQLHSDEGLKYTRGTGAYGDLAEDMVNDPDLLRKVLRSDHSYKQALKFDDPEELQNYLIFEHSDDLGNYIDRQRSEKGNLPTRHSEYQMEGPSENYRELVLQHDPEGHEKFREAAHFPNASNPLLHIRMSDRKGLNGEKLLHIEELQSDWGQQGADAGFNEQQKKAKEEKFQALNREMHALDFTMRNRARKAKIDAGANPDLVDNSDDSLHRIMQEHATPEEFDHYLKLKRNHDKALNDFRAPMIEEGPHVGDTNKWTDLGLKRILKEAADGGYHGITFAPVKSQAARWSTLGLEKPYDVTIPSRMQKLINNHDPSLKFGKYSHDLPIWHDPDSGAYSTIKVHYLPMSEKAAESIKEGQERFRRGGYAATPVAKSKNKIHNPAIIEHALNKIHSLPHEMDSTFSGQQGRLF